MSNDQKVTRKLRAILSADVKGYSLLMADDEAHTIQTLKAYRSLMSDLIQQQSGRVVDNPGDNLLAEFSSAVDAVECAIKIQNKLQKENAKFVEDLRLQFRMGVNIGDVVQDGDRIYGSGVNVAARIEGLADAGGICISRNTYDHVKDKLDLGFEYLGEHEVKNIEEPVRVYRVVMDSDAPKPLVPEYMIRRGPYISSNNIDGVKSLSIYELDNAKLADGMLFISESLAGFFDVPGFAYEVKAYSEIEEGLKMVGLG